MDNHSKAKGAIYAVACAVMETSHEGHCSSVMQLASAVTKASRFLYPLTDRYSQLDDKARLTVESDVLLNLASRYSREQAQ